MTTIVSIFDEILTAVRAKYDLAGLEMPYYMFGHPIEIGEIISEKANNSEFKYKRYPFICLFQDFYEEHTDHNVSASLNVAIVTNTKPNFKASERYNETFNKVLYPLFDLFIAEMNKNRHIDLSPSNVKFTKTDRLKWGRSNENVLNDYVDAIELTDLNLTFHKFC
jgi:hypothetical protein